MNESIPSSSNLLTKWFSDTSRTTRVCLTLVMIFVVIAAIQTSGLRSKTQMCELLGECPLRANELHRIQIALGQAGLDQFKVVDGKVLVPQTRRAHYLKTLAEGNALPEHLQQPKQETTNLNPFLSRTQQELIERNEKKRQIRELVARLPFVDEAWFEMDKAKSRTAFEPNRQTAVVSVQPIHGQELSPDEVKTIRQVIGGAIAGINSENIVVTDLGSGRAYQIDSVNHERMPSHHANFRSRKNNRESHFKRAVENALSTYPKVDVEVYYKSIARSQNNGSRFASMPNVENKTRNSMPNMSVGTNGQASVDELDHGVETAPSQSEIEMAKNLSTTYVESVSVVVSVPQRSIEEKYGLKKAKQLFGIPLEKLPGDRLDKSFEKFKSEVIEKIRPVLPLASFETSNGYPISVIMERNEPAAGHWSESLNDWVSAHWPTLAVLFIGLVMLMVVMRSNAPKESAPPTILSLDSEAIDSAEPRDEALKRSQAEEQLSRLIEQDPDTAAEVIKSWIRKAG